MKKLDKVEFFSLADDSIIGTVVVSSGLIFSVEVSLQGNLRIDEISQRGLPTAEELWEIYKQVLEYLRGSWKNQSLLKEQLDE